MSIKLPGTWHVADVAARPADRFIALLVVFGIAIGLCDLLFYSVNLTLPAFCAVSLLVAICLLLKGAELHRKSLGQDLAACRMGAYAMIAWRFTDRFLLLAGAGASLAFIAHLLSKTYEILIPLVLLLLVQLALRLSELWFTRTEAHKLARLSLAWRVRVYHGTQLVVAVIALLVFIYAFMLCATAGMVLAEIFLGTYLLGLPYNGLLRLLGSKKRQTPWQAERDRLREAFWTLLIPLWARTETFLQSRAANHLMGKYGRKFFE